MMILHVKALWHLVDLAPVRPHGSPGAALNTTGACVRLALLPGCRVVALREVEEMPHPANPA